MHPIDGTVHIFIIFCLSFPPGDYVMTLTATDADDPNTPNGKLEYYVIPDSNNPKDGSNYFNIDPNTGEVKVKGALDREVMSEYELTVAAADQSGEGTCKRLLIGKILNG